MKARFRSILILAVFAAVLITGIWALPVLVDKSYAAIKDAEEAARIAALPTPHPLESIFDSEAAKPYGFGAIAKGVYADYYFTLNSMDSRFMFIEAAEFMLGYITEELGVEFERPEICVYNAEEASGRSVLQNELNCDISDFNTCWYSFSKLFGEAVPGWYPVALYNYLLADKTDAMTAEDALKWYEENKDNLPPLSDFWLTPELFPNSDTAFEALMAMTAEKFESGLKTYEEMAEAIGFSEGQETIRLGRPGEYIIENDKLIVTFDTLVYDFDYATIRKSADTVQKQVDLVQAYIKPMIMDTYGLFLEKFTEFTKPNIEITFYDRSISSDKDVYKLPYNDCNFTHHYATYILSNANYLSAFSSQIYYLGLPRYLNYLTEKSMGFNNYDMTYMGGSFAEPAENRLYEIYKIVCGLDGLDPAYKDADALLKAKAIQELYELGITVIESVFILEISYTNSSYTDFIRYICDTYGSETIYEIYYNYWSSSLDLETDVGKTIEELISDWKADINYDEVIRLYEEINAAP